MASECTFPALVIDSASQVVTVGLARSGQDRDAAVWARRRDEAGVGVFAAVDEVLRHAETRLADVRALVFCEGPGSLLGIRIAAMAIRVWQTTVGSRMPGGLPCFSYQSLALVAADLLDGATRLPFAIISDARRGAWNLLRLAEQPEFAPLRRSTAEDVARLAEPTFHPDGFARWQPLPAAARPVPYRPERLLQIASSFPLLRPCSVPDAFMIEAPEYRKAPVERADVHGPRP